MDRNAQRETIRRLREKTLQIAPGDKAAPEVREHSARNRLRMASADLQLGRIVQRNPWASIAVFAAAGFIVGYWPAMGRSLVMGAAAAAKNMETNRSALRQMLQKQTARARK